MYKYLMVYISVFELLYGLLGLIVQPDFYSYSSLFLVIARTDRLGLPIWMIRIVNTMFCSMFGMSMAMFTLHFIYRYCVIKGSTFVKTDSTLKIFVWFRSPILYGLVWGIILLTTLGPSDSTNKVLKQSFFPKNKITVEQVSYIGPNYYVTDRNGTESLNRTVCAGMAVIITMVSISILTIVVFAYKCYEGVNSFLRESHHSEGFKSLQSQLLNMLVVQVAIPAVLMHGPSSILFTGPIFHISSEIAGWIILYCSGYISSAGPSTNNVHDSTLSTSVRNYREEVAEPGVVIKVIQLWAQRVCAILSVSINTVLIELILFRSPNGIGMYKYLMVYISAFELLFAFLVLIMQPDIYTHSGVLLVIARTDRFGLPIWFVQATCTLFCCMFGMSMAMFTLHFIYRYCVIKGSKLIKMDSTFKLCLWFLTPILYGFIWSVALNSTMGKNESTDKILKELYLPKHGVTIDQIAYLGPNYYVTDEAGVESLNWKVLGGMSVLFTMVTISILIIIIFAYKCYKGVGVLLQESHHSEGYKTLQSQLLNMLVVQVCIPAVLMHCPSSILFTGAMLHMGNEFVGGLFAIAIAVYPVLDPLPTMFMIQHYRQVLRKIVRKTLKLRVW